MRRLGAIIAGGTGSRFGGDKARAMLDGRPLVEHVVDGLRRQVDHLIICGRAWPGFEMVADRPTANLGPLGGLNAALHYAQLRGFDFVLSAGCDVLPVPVMPAPPGNDTAMFVAGHFLFGWWPVSLAPLLDAHLAQQRNHAVKHWIATIGAQPICPAIALHNLNTQTDVAHYAECLRATA